MSLSPRHVPILPSADPCGQLARTIGPEKLSPPRYPEPGILKSRVYPNNSPELSETFAVRIWLFSHARFIIIINRGIYAYEAFKRAIYCNKLGSLHLSITSNTDTPCLSLAWTSAFPISMSNLITSAAHVVTDSSW
jgi:hypothetical protein